MPPATFDITRDDLSALQGPDPAFVTFGEVMVRDTPADAERPERTRLVHLSMAGSEYTLAIGLSRLGIESAYITRVPDNPYGRAVRNIAREHGVNTDHIVWAPRTDLIGRMIYEIGRTPRRDVGVYQRKYSAASALDAGMVDWAGALRGAKLFHTSGITFGLARHSGYDRNYNLEAFKEAVAARPADCMVGLDFNYRSTLWSAQEARDVMTPLVTEHVDVLVTTIEDMAELYGIGCGQYTAKADQRRRYRSARRRRHPLFCRGGHSQVRRPYRRHHHPLPRYVRATPLGIGGSRRGRRFLPLAGDSPHHPVGSAGRRRHLERRLLLRPADRRVQRSRADQGHPGRRRGDAPQTNPHVRSAHH